MLRGAPAEVPPDRRPRAATLQFPRESAVGAVFGLRATVPGDAFTARTLGTEREGNGVLVGADGLVATVGYLITEAASVELTDAGGRRIPTAVVGFVQETGLGLVRDL